MNHPDDPTQGSTDADAAGAEPAETIDFEAGEPEVPEAPEGAAPADRRAVSPVTWILSGLLVLALVVGIAWFAASSSRAGREAAQRNAATGYLTAIAEGDAAAALDHLAEAPTNTALLTDAVLAVSNAAAPLADIEAGQIGGDELAPTVEVTYRLGDQSVATTIALVGEGRAWKVDDGTVDLAVPERRGLTVNGVALTEETNPVFPGTYTAEVVSPMVALTGEATAVVTEPGQADARIELSPGLSEVGTQTTFDAVKGRFDECLAATESRPANCPFGVGAEGVEVADGSVRFSLSNDPWEGFAPTLDPATLQATGTFHYEINATATVTREGLSLDATLPLVGDRGYEVDLAQQPAVVTWS